MATNLWDIEAICSECNSSHNLLTMSLTIADAHMKLYVSYREKWDRPKEQTKEYITSQTETNEIAARTKSDVPFLFYDTGM
jgi:hypothetical protein